MRFVSDIDYVNRRMKAGCVCVLCISVNHQNFKALNILHLSFAFLTFVERSNPSSLPSPLLDLRTVMFSKMTTKSVPAATVFIVSYKAENKTTS